MRFALAKSRADTGRARRSSRSVRLAPARAGGCLGLLRAGRALCLARAAGAGRWRCAARAKQLGLFR